MLEGLRAQAASLKREGLVLWFVTRDPRAPWYAKGLPYSSSPMRFRPST
jgi:uncharacterized membrane protein YkvA (DUF1232 family)